MLFFALCIAGFLLFLAIRLFLRLEQRNNDKRDGILRLELCLGDETFTTTALPRGRRYRIKITGTYGSCEADACYRRSGGNFTERHTTLFLNGKSAGEPYEEDRSTHTYFFPYVATGKKLSILLKERKHESRTSYKPLRVVIIPLSAKEQAALEERAERDREEQEGLRRKQTAQEELLLKQQEENERRQEQEERRAKLQPTIYDLTVRVQLEQNYLDADHRANLAKYKTEEILARKAEFGEEYGRIKSDPELVAMLEQQAPEVLDWLEARLEIIALAERAEVAPPPASPPTKRRRLTEAQIRAQKAYTMRRAARDKMAQKTTILDAVREFEESLKEYELDDDDRERIVSEFVEELLTKEEGEAKKLH